MAIAECRNQSREAESGCARLGDRCNLPQNHIAHVHVHLHDESVDQASLVHVEVRSVRGRSEVEVGKHASSLSQSGEVLPQNLPWSPFSIQNKLPS